MAYPVQNSRDPQAGSNGQQSSNCKNSYIRKPRECLLGRQNTTGGHKYKTTEKQDIGRRLFLYLQKDENQNRNGDGEGRLPGKHSRPKSHSFVVGVKMEIRIDIY